MLSMFIAALLTIAKIWKQPKCLSTDELLNKTIYTHTHTHTMEYYSVIKTNEILPFTTTWMGLEVFILSRISQTKRQILYVITYLKLQQTSEKIWTYRYRKQTSGCQWEVGQGRGTTVAGDLEVWTTTYKTDKLQGYIIQHRKYSQCFKKL